MGERKTIWVRDMGRIFVYGSLRKGHYNHNYLNFNTKTKYLDTVKLKKAKLYDLGDYPCVVVTDEPSDVVVGEIYEFSDLELEDIVRRMELNAGFIKETVVIEGLDYSIYIFRNIPQSAELIRSGDWNTVVNPQET